MNMEQASTFLSGSILVMLALIVVFIGAVIINNIIYKFWKPIKLWQFHEYPPARFATPEELGKTEPKMTDTKPTDK